MFSKVFYVLVNIKIITVVFVHFIWHLLQQNECFLITLNIIFMDNMCLSRRPVFYFFYF